MKRSALTFVATSTRILATSALLVGVAGTTSIVPTAEAAATTPDHLGLAAGGQYTTGLRLQWDWSKADSRYQVQVAPNDSFDGATTASITRSSSAPANRLQATTVRNLQTATWYYARVRSIQGTEASAWSSPVKVATAVAWPDPITSVTSTPGPGAGQLTVRWASTGRYVSHYRIDTALSLFSRTDPTLPSEGRNARSFRVPGHLTSLTLTPEQLADAGAPVGSANHLYLRVYAITEGNAGSHERSFASLRSSAVQPVAASGQIPIRVASYNVRTAGAGDTGQYSWPSRAPYAAKTILSEAPGVVALQELSPGPMDGRSSSVRQTDSLVAQLAAAGGSRYKLVRRSSYFPAGTETGSQGARILYDTDRYRLLSDCPEITKVEVDGTLVNKGFNQACSFTLPLRDGDSEEYRRSVAFAQLETIATGTKFWFVSVHLDHRSSDDPIEEQSFETLRGQQVDAIVDTMNALNAQQGTPVQPIIFAGDLNSWQNTSADYAPHNELIEDGFYDTAAAVSRINFSYDTVNKFALTQRPSSSGWGARLDTILVKGATGANRFKIVVTPTDPRRGSDHNLVVADFALPAGS